MAEMVSPGVYVSESDLSTIAVNDSQTTSVFAGNFTKGPLEKYTQITNTDELIEFYGKPTNDNYNDWYQCYNFLQYSNNLLISRACNINGAAVDLTSKFKAYESIDGYGVQEWGTSEYGIGSDSKWVFTDVNSGLKAGDIVVFADDEVQAIENSPKFLVLEVQEGQREYLENPIDPSSTVTEHVYGILVDREPTMLVDNKEVPVVVNTSIYKIIISLNGSTEALALKSSADVDSDITGTDELTLGWKTVKKTTYKVNLNIPKYLDNSRYYSKDLSILNIEREDIDTGEWYTETYEKYDILDPKLPDSAVLFKNNKQIKNDDHFDLIKSSLSVSNANSKLKFFSRTPGTEDAKYQICIAVPSDFAVNDVRFVGNHCSRYAFEGVSLDGLFEYVPQVGTAQIAVVIFDPLESEVKETFLCSLDPKEVDSYNNSMYIEDVINRKSNLVYVVDNKAMPAVVDVREYVLKVNGDKIQTGTDTLGDPIYRTQVVTVPNIASYCYVYDSINNFYYGRTLSLECAHDSTIQADDLMNAYEVFDNKEDLNVDYIIGNELDNGNSALNLAETRQDCIAYVGIPLEYNNKPVCIGQKASIATNNIVKFRNSINYNSMWISLLGNYKYQYDRYNDIYRWINIAGDGVGLRAKCTVENDAWWASAGLDRGQIKNVTKLAYAPNQTQRGTLYTNGINPIVTFPGEGTVLWGQKTMLSKNSSFSRVNVRCLFNTIERTLAEMSRYSVFEFNDSFTRNKVISTIKPYLAQVQAGRGIQDFRVICDTSNNTAQIIAENKLVVDIYIKPTYVAEMIHLRFFNVGTNDFSTVITE